MELIIRHRSGRNGSRDRIQVAYRPHPDAMLMESEEGDFTFALTDRERGEIQWYLEEYLQFPRGEFQLRATQVEALLEAKGQALFEATFGDHTRYFYYR